METDMLGILKSGEAVYDRPRSHLHEGVLPFLVEVLPQIDSEGREFFTVAHDFGQVIGKSSCVTTGEEDEILFARRVNRDGFTRFVKGRETEVSTSLIVILKRIERGYLLVTSFVGNPTPPEPWDPNADEASEPFWAAHALVWGSESVVEGTEIPETPTPAASGQNEIESLEKVLNDALAWGQSRHPNASPQHHAAFANSVSEAVTGWAGGYGGPSIRQYTSLGELTRLGRSSGQTVFNEAVVLLEEACYGPIRENHVWMCVANGAYPGDRTFDDAPSDVEAFWRIVKNLPLEKKCRVQW